MREMNTKTQLDDAALRYHSEGRPGKIGIVPTKPYHTQYDLSLAYSPGVAAPSLAIAEEPDDVYKYTGKGNLVAVISNGTAVLGLGNIGPLAAKPVMEGKSMLFKTYAGIDAFDIEVDTTDPEEFIRTVKAIAPTFGGINLEDIKAPECFYIEQKLKEICNIPIFHDDQHGTAVITLAGLTNYVEEHGCDIGIATDGDADRLGIIDDEGHFVHPNQVLVLLYYYLLKYKNWHGPCVRNIATTHLLDRVAEAFGETCYEVPVGFKHISAAMQEHNAVIGGESSGGLTVRGHINGKDGIYAATLLVEMLSVTGKSMSQLMKEIYAEFGTAYMSEFDWPFDQEMKEKLHHLLMVEKQLPAFPIPVVATNYMDGCKVYFKNGGWVIARFSGTEPLLRVFCEMGGSGAPDRRDGGFPRPAHARQNDLRYVTVSPEQRIVPLLRRIF